MERSSQSATVCVVDEPVTFVHANVPHYAKKKHFSDFSVCVELYAATEGRSHFTLAAKGETLEFQKNKREFSQSAATAPKMEKRLKRFFDYD